jgi:outer membrane biosynthesis protein TonB
MWKENVDTSAVFRNLENLQAMGIADGKFTVSQGEVSQEQFTSAIKQTLVPLYRNDPEAIDSLFDTFAVPRLEEADLGPDAVQESGRLNPDLVQKFKNEAYKAIANNYQEPSRLESDGGLVYPESLRTAETSGTVTLQVHVDSTGAPDAIEAIQGVHPTLDAIAMRAAAERRWEPAYVLVNDNWQPRPSWVRFDVNYPAPR